MIINDKIFQEKHIIHADLEFDEGKEKWCIKASTPKYVYKFWFPNKEKAQEKFDELDARISNLQISPMTSIDFAGE